MFEFNKLKCLLRRIWKYSPHLCRRRWRRRKRKRPRSWNHLYRMNNMLIKSKVRFPFSLWMLCLLLQLRKKLYLKELLNNSQQERIINLLSKCLKRNKKFKVDNKKLNELKAKKKKTSDNPSHLIYLFIYIENTLLSVEHN